MNPTLPEAILEEIKAELRAGMKIGAIKRLHEATGLGLAEAKAAIEKLHAELHAKEPGAYPDPGLAAGGGKGCAVVLLLVGVGVALLVFLLRR